jgi:hypothetical protein
MLNHQKDSRNLRKELYNSRFGNDVQKAHQKVQ